MSPAVAARGSTNETKNRSRASRAGSDLRDGARVASRAGCSEAKTTGAGAIGQAPDPPHPPLHLQCVQQHALWDANRSTGCTGESAVQTATIRIHTSRFMQEGGRIPVGAPTVNPIICIGQEAYP
jgi:hypothetical protein